jgi:hypothetical protein
MHENRETSGIPGVNPRDRSAGEGNSRTARMHVFEESDPAVLPMKSPNNARPVEGIAAEVMEGRAGAKENCECVRTCRTQSRVPRFQCAASNAHAAGMAARANIQSGSRMRQFRSYGSVRGRAVMFVPTATAPG